MHRLLNRLNANQDAQAFYPYSEYSPRFQHAVYYLKHQFLLGSVLEPDHFLLGQAQNHASHFEKLILNRALRLLLLTQQALLAAHLQFPDEFAQYGYDKSRH